MKTKRIIILLLALAMTVAMLPMLSGRAKAAEVTLVGSGTPEDPYLIGTKEELEKFRDIVNGANNEIQNSSICAKLTANIDLSNELWTPIGDSGEHKYSGFFDGAGYSITGLNVDFTGDYAGLFGIVYRGYLYNLNVYGNVIGGSSVGGIAGKIVDSDINFCFFKGTVHGSAYDDKVMVGGLVGFVDDFSILYYCSCNGIVSGWSKNHAAVIGGVVGLTSFSEISHSNFLGTVECFTPNDVAIGGLVGEVYISALYYSHSSGTVNSKSGGENCVGGFVGYVYNSSMRDVITNCSTTANVIATDGNVYSGGFVGEIRLEFDSSCQNCYSTGNVTVNSSNSVIVGGFASNIRITGNSTIKNCYCTGSPTANGVGEGGFAGSCTGTIENCYYLNGKENSFGKKVDLAFLTDSANFSNWKHWFMGADGPKYWDAESVNVTTWSELYEALQKNGNGIKLTADVKYGTGGGAYENTALVVPENTSVTLDLNGHTIDRGLADSAAEESGRVISIRGGNGKLTLIDSCTGGTITGGNTIGNGGGVLINGYFVMYGGIITGNNASWNGGGVHVGSGYFYMYGGEITNNVVNSDPSENGQGGGVCINYNSYFFVSGSSTITGNKIYSDSNELISNVFLSCYNANYNPITLLGALSDEAKIGIQMETPDVFTNGLNYNSTTDSNGSLTNFTSDNPEYAIVTTDSGEFKLIPADVVECCGTLKLDGRELSEKDVFRFEIYENDVVVATGQNNIMGEILFTPLYYDFISCGEHTYTVKQCATDIPGVSIDETEHTVDVFVFYRDDKITANPTENFTNLYFYNTYTKQTPKYTVPEGLSAIYGQSLVDVMLPDGWKWDDSATTSVGDVGENYFSATYIPADTVNYFSETEKLTISVSKAPAPKVITSEQKPAAIEGLSDNGLEQALLTAPKTVLEGYTIEYSTDGTNWSKTIPTGKEPGEYKIQTSYVGDKNHESFTGENVTVIIKAVYTVIWLDGNGAELDKKNYVEGSTEPITDKTPTKANADSSYFIFDGWDNGTVEGTTKKYTPSFTKKPLYTSEVGTLEYTMGENKEAIVRIIGNQNNTGLVGRVKTIGTDTKKAVFGTDVLLKEGSLIITFAPGYLDSLGAGEHMIRVVFDDGEVSFLARIVPVDSTPVTGDTMNPFLFAALISLSLAGFAVMLEKRRKKA